MRRWTIIVVLGLILGGAAIVTLQALGIRTVVVDAKPSPQTGDGFDWDGWDQSLSRWVRGSRVDYDSVLRDRKDLRQLAATLAAYGPKETPKRFATTEERLAYYINAYNALVLLGVVENWPIKSVFDVHGWLEPKAGFGFFYGLRFLLDGGRVNLYDLENGVIRGFGDARIHAAINCASVSCPPLAPYAFRATKLDGQLDEVTRAFCSSPVYVRVDPDARKIELSAIFDWYRTDFEEHARRLGQPPTVLGFVKAFASPEVRSKVEKGEAAGFETSFLPYNWALNSL